MQQREGLIARVRQMRRIGSVSEPSSKGAPPSPEDRTLSSLEARIRHLEELLEGFQDSVHRESVRQDGRLTELEARTDPAALAAALSRDARERGL